MKKAISILLSLVMLFALCGSANADLSAEERERIYQEVAAEKAAAEKAAAEETASIEMPDLFGIWYDINSKATIEVKEDAAYMNNVTIWNAERTHGLTTFGWHIENGELVEHPVGMTEEWLKACGHLFKRIKIVEDDGILQLHYLSGVYVREDDIAAVSASGTAQSVTEEEIRQLLIGEWRVGTIGSTFFDETTVSLVSGGKMLSGPYELDLDSSEIVARITVSDGTLKLRMSYIYDNGELTLVNNRNEVLVKQ